MFSLLMETRERDNESAAEARAQKLHHQLITVMANEATQFESIVAHLDDSPISWPVTESASGSMIARP